MPVQQYLSVQSLQQADCLMWRYRLIAALFLLIGVLPSGVYALTGWNRASAATGISLHSRVESIKHFLRRGVQNPDQIAAQVDSLLQTQLAQQQFSGSVLVAQGAQILLAKGYGDADVASHTPNRPDTRFFLGSLTKEFTALAIVILQQQGKLRIDASVCNYIADCPPQWQAVTIQQLLTHTSGIAAPANLSPASPEAWIASFANASLQFTPGGMYSYCSVCYQILGYVVQHVSGQPYSQFIQQIILDPVHMQRSGFDVDTYYADPNHANGYETWHTLAPRDGFTYGPAWSFLDASGLLYSTVQDLYLWDRALTTNLLLSQDVLQQVYTPYVSAENLFPGSNYGYGWFITRSPIANHRLYWHDGVIDGFRNYIGRYIDDNLTIIFLSNLTTLDPIALAHSIEQAAL